MKRALLLVLIPATAYAGGTERPNGISARGTGMGGAWCAWADDATAVFFNPGAMDAIDPHVMLGGELVVGPRSYTPVATNGTRGAAQDTTVIAPLPSIGAVGRFTYDDRPSRFTLGAGLWNTFGGSLSYAKSGMPALDATRDVVIEANAAAAFHVSDRLAIGGAFRFGLGLFHVESTQMPYDANLSSTGVGVGMTWGALLRPTDSIRIGITWRSPLRVTTKGSGTVTMGTPGHYEIRHEQDWPQQASVGVGWQQSRQLKLAAQVDWTQWSELIALTVEFPAGTLPTQRYPEYWKDSWTVRGGAEYAVSSTLAIRGGAYFDTAAVPDRTIERQYTDSNKLGLSVGASLHAGGWRFDAALDGLIPHTRTVEANATAVMGFTPLVNIAPGDYTGSLVTFELAAARPF